MCHNHMLSHNAGQNECTQITCSVYPGMASTTGQSQGSTFPSHPWFIWPGSFSGRKSVKSKPSRFKHFLIFVQLRTCSLILLTFTHLRFNIKNISYLLEESTWYDSDGGEKGSGTEGEVRSQAATGEVIVAPCYCCKYWRCCHVTAT